ncbi:UPF0481 protein At3g47200 [Corylus avellana]|uniref:UPF0481 protein At3g47200 n=1 Tax=Corylus avellana TaxID=13451 RepID=UPI001E2145D7|nr:UPF0481 protein At3g47200 [Corylus avellana]
MDPHAFDIENPYVPLANSLKEEFQSLSPPFSTECSIYRVPERLLHIKEKAYTPKVVSIGPLHHGMEGLKAMEAHKKRYLQDFIQRTNKSLEFYIQVVKEKEARLRGCYAETIQFSSDAFVKIILVDAAFIIEVLLRHNFHELQDKNDCIFNKPWMLQDVWPDLRLLENQLPFFILEDLFDPKKITVSSQQNEIPSIIELSHNFFKKVIYLEGTKDKFENFRSSKVEHFVDLLRHLHLPLKEQPKGKIKTLTTPTMTDLQQAGVRFNVGSSRNLFDIQFSEGILEIPKLILSDETELLILNLLAFEQLHYGENYINDYVIIMDCLVNTPKDVDLLVKYEIVENRLGGDSNEGSTIINKLGKVAILDNNNFCFASLCEELNKYYRTPWHKWKANLKQNYFNTPWASTSVVAGVILLVLTLIQTVCSIMSTFSDGKKH